MRQGIWIWTILMLGCATAEHREPAKNAPTVVRENTRFDNDAFRVQVSDMNHDGAPDVWKYYAEKSTLDGPQEFSLVRKELDLNFDGRIDRVMYYNSRENLSREEVDADFDGFIDRVQYYDRAILVKSEICSAECCRSPIDAPEKSSRTPNRVLFFSKGVLTREEVDSQCRGRVESISIFNNKKELIQTGYDTNGDESIDSWVKY